MNQGDIVLVRFPFSNRVDYMIRPSVIVSNNEFNCRFDTWVCPLTSTQDANIAPLNGFLNEGKLEKNTYAKTSVLVTIEDNLILRKIGSLNAKGVKFIIEKLKQNF